MYSTRVSPHTRLLKEYFIVPRLLICASQLPNTIYLFFLDGMMVHGRGATFFVSFLFCAFCVMFRYSLADELMNGKLFFDESFLFLFLILCILSSPNYNPLIKATTNYPLSLLFFPILTRITHHTRPNTPNLRPNLMPLLLSFTP